MLIASKSDKWLTSKKSDDLTLNCDYSGGKPDPVVSWLYNGKLIEISNNNHQKYSAELNNLTVKNVQLEDDGIYSCILSNGYHKSQSVNFTLNVIGKF